MKVVVKHALGLAYGRRTMVSCVWMEHIIRLLKSIGLCLSVLCAVCNVQVETYSIQVVLLSLRTATGTAVCLS